MRVRGPKAEVFGASNLERQIAPFSHVSRFTRHGLCPCGLLQHPMLLPVRGEDALELRLLLWGTSTPARIIPAHAGIYRELSHRLDELIHLRTEQHLAIARLNRLRPIGCSDKPVLHSDLVVGRSIMNGNSKIVGLFADDEIQRIDATVEQYLVHTAIIVLDEILSIATAKEVGIVVIASVQRVVPSSTTQGIVPRQPGEEVFAVVTGEDVIERITRAFEVSDPGQLQIFYIGAQRVVQGGNHRVRARVQRFGDHVTSNTNRVGVVAKPTLHEVAADTTIEAVVAAIAIRILLSALPVPLRSAIPVSSKFSTLSVSV